MSLVKFFSDQVSYAYVIAFQSLLTNIETAKTVSFVFLVLELELLSQVYMHASGGSKTLEVTKDSFLCAGQTVSRLTPLEVTSSFVILHTSPSQG